ncbi:MAG: aldehyde dehydrogenase [Candidatus Zixiibacteriota bacterium]
MQKTDIKDILKKQREFFDSGKTKSYEFRKKQLANLRRMIDDKDDLFYDALMADLHKSKYESYATEIGFTLSEISYAEKHLKKWMKPDKVRTPLLHFPAKSRIYYEPYGLSLIISPWNYPFQLALSPLIGAISAGNCAILKPSEFSPATSEALKDAIAEYFEPGFVTVVLGEVETSKALLAEIFDYIFFTGSPGVGKAVMTAAAKHLTPVTLELGGKSPVIVHEDAKLDIAAKKITWGKFLNAGQTCIAPDYALVHSSIKEQFIERLVKYITQFYQPNIRESSDYGRIITQKHFGRLESLLDGGKIVYGGQTDRSELFFEPTILTELDLKSKVMEEEIFGPIFPILEYDNIEEAMEFIESKSKPLSLYLFSESKKIEKMVTGRLSFGGGCINDVILHLATPHLPFGGVGRSGMGAYHGKESFLTFSHRKSILHKGLWFDLPLKYPPNKMKNFKWLKKAFK